MIKVKKNNIQKSVIAKRKTLMLKILIMLEYSLDSELISKNNYFRLKSGVDAIINECENFVLNKTSLARTSEISMVKMAKVSKDFEIDKNDIIVKNFIDEEIKLLKNFEKFVEEQQKFGIDEFMNLLNKQEIINEKMKKKLSEEGE